jgi:hypothetical protein
MKLSIRPDIFFPGSVITTDFGWDTKTFPGKPRIHAALDRAGPSRVHTPIESERSAWLDNDAEGNSVLRLFFPGGEFRMLHFIRDELDSGCLAAALAGAGLAIGAPIGPVGNHGIFVASKGGTGRHVHLSLIVEPDSYDEDLAERIGSGWNTDSSADYLARYGSAYANQVKQRGIEWMNEHLIARHDPYYGGRLRYYVNPRVYGL